MWSTKSADQLRQTPQSTHALNTFALNQQGKHLGFPSPMYLDTRKNRWICLRGLSADQLIRFFPLPLLKRFDFYSAVYDRVRRVQVRALPS